MDESEDTPMMAMRREDDRTVLIYVATGQWHETVAEVEETRSIDIIDTNEAVDALAYWRSTGRRTAPACIRDKGTGRTSRLQDQGIITLSNARGINISFSFN